MRQAKTCLIIDDDPEDQEIFVMCVEKMDVNVDCKTCENGVEAISMLKSDEEFIPDYIFLDVNMPKMNGMDCLKELRKIEKLKNTRILMYSTTTENNMVIESKQFGADDFIIKPTKIVELKDKLYNFFNLSLK